MADYTQSNIVERSYQLAKTGNYDGTPQIRRQLLVEGFTQSAIATHFSSPLLTRTLVDLCRHAQGKPKRLPPPGRRRVGDLR
jgi:hypothetical protein